LRGVKPLPMQRLSRSPIIFRSTAILFVYLTAGTCLGQSKQAHATLCDLQGKVTEGEHISVEVSGVYEGGLGATGPAEGLLEESSCPDQNAWVDMALKTNLNRKKLNGFLDRANRAYVVFEGDLYGPPLPDPKLPENIRKVYHPGWGHLGAFKTKLVVHTIRYVAPAPRQNSER